MNQKLHFDSDSLACSYGSNLQKASNSSDDSEPMLTQLIDAYLRHLGEMS